MIHTYVINKEEGRLLGLIWNLLIITQRYKTQFCKSNVFPSQNWPHLAQKSPFPLGDQTRRTKQKLQADSFGITRVPQKIVIGEYIFSLFFFFSFFSPIGMSVSEASGCFSPSGCVHCGDPGGGTLHYLPQIPLALGHLSLVRMLTYKLRSPALPQIWVTQIRGE